MVNKESRNQTSLLCDYHAICSVSFKFKPIMFDFYRSLRDPSLYQAYRKAALLMVWVFEKKVFYHILDMGFESVGIPVRVKFEFDVQEGSFIPDSLEFESIQRILY